MARIRKRPDTGIRDRHCHEHALVFSFAVGGLACSLYDAWCRRPLERMPDTVRHQHRHRFHRLALSTPVIVFVPLDALAGINAIYVASLSLLAGALAAMLCRPDLRYRMLKGAVIFGAFNCLFFATMTWFHPAFVSGFWNMGAISGMG